MKKYIFSIKRFIFSKWMIFLEIAVLFYLYFSPEVFISLSELLAIVICFFLLIFVYLLKKMTINFSIIVDYLTGIDYY